MKQLFLDISELVNRDAKSGIQRVVRSIMQQLLTTPPNNYIVKPVYTEEGEYFRYANTFTSSFTMEEASYSDDEPIQINEGDIFVGLDFTAHFFPKLTPILYQFQKAGVKVYYIVYDLLLIQNPSWWPEGTNALFESWLKGISETSSGLICISESVAIEVREWLTHNPPNRSSLPEVMSFHLGADVDNSVPSTGLPEDAEFVFNQLASRPSFLSVGTVEPRKGHSQTLLAFEKLWMNGVDANFVIIGKQGWMVDELVEKIRNHPELNKRLFWLEGISDEYLEKVYVASSCLIAASEGEGFGLPLIEAAQHKLPIIARDIPVFREVAGGYAYYFADDNNPAVLADIILNWLELHKNNEQPKSDNMPWLTWKESSEQLLSSLGIEYKIHT
jgi:glycosyltransferase involved in cell wall biosynthesis